MRKLITWLLVTLGIAALVRKLRRRDELPEPSVAPAPTTEDPADELRRKLAETRTDEEVSARAPAEASVEERRAAVHEQGQSALGEMQPSGEPAGEPTDGAE